MRRIFIVIALVLPPLSAAAQAGSTNPASAVLPGPTAPVQSNPVAAAPFRRRPFEIGLALGFGNAVCDNKKPDSDCPVDGASAVSLGAAWRFRDHFAVGLELAAWRFKVREAWRGQLDMPATDVGFSSSSVGLAGRWYWFRDGRADPYVHAGVGVGSVDGEATNANGSYRLKAAGATYHLGIGVEWQVTPIFRLGPQALATLHVSNEICETINGGAKTCRSPRENTMGEREGVALPWRLVVAGTFTLGAR